MAESREKSHKQFEKWATTGNFAEMPFELLREDGADNYVWDDTQDCWESFQDGEKFGREAGRRDALEEAIKAICYHCRMGIPVEPPSESLVFWHRDINSGRLDICQAAAIRALKEKGTETDHGNRERKI